MSPEAGAGHLECSGRPDGASGLQIRECIKHRGRTIEICGKPGAAGAVEHRIEANLEHSGTMSGKNLFSQREVLPIRRRDSLAPAAANSRHPSGLARATALPSLRIHICACSKKRPVEPHLRFRRRASVNRSRWDVKYCRLHRIRRSCLLGRQLQQPEETGVLRSQLNDLLAQCVQLGVQGVGRPATTESGGEVITKGQCRDCWSWHTNFSLSDSCCAAARSPPGIAWA